MSITSADFDRVCTGDVMRLDYGSDILPNLREDERPEFPRGVDQAALRQSYAYMWAQTLGADLADRNSTFNPAMYVLSAPTLSVELAELSSEDVSCLGYRPSNDGTYLEEVVSSRTETYELSSTEVSSFQLCCDWRTMRYVQSQNAWCLLNTPVFRRFDGSYSGVNLKNTLMAVAELQDRARRDVIYPSNRFFLSRESNQWLKNLDGTLLSTVQTSSSLDLTPDSLFRQLVAPHVSAADFGKSLSAVLSGDAGNDWTFLDLSAVSCMYEPLVELDQTTLMMEPGLKLIDYLQCAGHWDETEKTTDVSGEYKTSADFIQVVAGTDGYPGFHPACPLSLYRKRIHMGYETDEEGENKKTLWRDVDRKSEATCQLCAYVQSLSAGYDNRPELSALAFRDNAWMRQRKTQGVRNQKLLVMTASLKRQCWNGLSGYGGVKITADVYADLVDTQTDVHRISALVEDAVTREDAQCMLADMASTLPYARRMELERRFKDVQVDLPLSGELWRDDSWSKLDSPSPIWELLAARAPSLPSLHPVPEYGDSSAEAWTGLVGCWAVTEVDSPLRGLVP